MSETTFVPRPGSASDAVAKIEVAEQPKPMPASGGGTRNPQPVKVRDAIPEDGVWRTLVLMPGQARQMLPQDPDRARAVILAVDQAVILCETQALAQSPNNSGSQPAYPDGFYLSLGIPVPVYSKGLVWVVNASNSSYAHVSVLVERYENA